MMLCGMGSGLEMSVSAEDLSSLAWSLQLWGMCSRVWEVVLSGVLVPTAVCERR